MTRTKAALLLACFTVLLALTLADYAALHDIWWDFVSVRIAEKYPDAIDLEALPDWTRTEGEWTLATISLYGRAVLLLASLAAVGAHLGRGSLMRRITIVTGTFVAAAILAMALAMGLVAMV